jgi:hypothetical protein
VQAQKKPLEKRLEFSMVEVVQLGNELCSLRFFTLKQ